MFSARPAKRISIVRWTISVLLLIPILTIWVFFLTGYWQTFQVISGSMEPTLLVNDYIIMRKQHHFPVLDQKVVAITDPLGGSAPLVKRVVAGPHSTVRISNGRIYIGNASTPLPGEPLMYAQNKTWNLTGNEIFVLGDNRNNSEDSVAFGPIPRESVIGVMTWRYWPFDRISSIH